MTELPAESPEAGAPFYRTSTLLVLARSAKHADEFWEKIPVVQVDGRTVDFWTVDEARLRALLSDNRT